MHPSIRSINTGHPLTLKLIIYNSLTMLSISDSQVIAASLDRSFHGFRRMQVIDDSTILLTEGPHVAAVYDTQTGKSIGSWYFSESERLTCPLVFDYVRKKYIAVQQDHYLRLMDLSRTADEQSEGESSSTPAQGDSSVGKRYRFGKPIVCVIANKDGEALVLFDGGGVKPLSAAVESRADKSSITYFPPEKIIRVEPLTQVQSSVFARRPENQELIVISESTSGKWYHRLQIDKSNYGVELYETFQLPEDLIVLGIHPHNGFVCGINTVGEVILVKHGLAKVFHKLQPVPQATSTKSDQNGSDKVAGGENGDPYQWPKVRCVTFFTSHEDLVGLFIDSTECDSEFTILLVDLRFGFTRSIAISLPPLDSSSVQMTDGSMYIISTSGLSIHSFTINPVTLASISRERVVSNNLISNTNNMSSSSSSLGNDGDGHKDSCELSRLLVSLPSMKISDILQSLKEIKKKTGIYVPERITAILVNVLICRHPDLKQCETEQLMEVILRTSFNTNKLAQELKPKLPEPSQILKTISILLDRASEEDAQTAQVLDLISTLIDCSLTQILSQVDSLTDLLTELKSKLDQISCFYTVATSLKSHINAILCKNYKFEPSIALKTEDQNQIPPYSIVTIYI